MRRPSRVELRIGGRIREASQGGQPPCPAEQNGGDESEGEGCERESERESERLRVG